MRRCFYLSTCSTCKRILQEVPVSDAGIPLQDIKHDPITPEQLEEMKRLAGSYEALFSRRAMNFRKLGLNDQQLSEEDFRHYILQDYTFLKRPVTVLGESIFIGNSAKSVAALNKALTK